MSNNIDAKLLYFEKFNNLPEYIPMMASYDDPIFQRLMILAVALDKPLEQKDIDKAYANKFDLIRSEEDPVDIKKLFNL